MVRLHVKRGDESQFLFDTNVSESVSSVLQEITAIYNGRLKVYRLCYDIEDLANHGTMLPPEMIGLTDEQIEELKLKDTWADKCIPSGGFDYNRDQIGRRNGHRPKENMRAVLLKAIEDARNAIDKKLVLTNNAMTLKIVEEAINLLRGAVTIVYPMQLPPHDVIRMEFSNTEDLAGTQASKEVIEPCKAQLWFAGHQMIPGTKLSDKLGSNDKTKVVVKLNKLGEGPPGREAVITEDIKKRMMADAYRRQEELKVSLKLFVFVNWEFELRIPAFTCLELLRRFILSARFLGRVKRNCVVTAVRFLEIEVVCRHGVLKGSN